jgi:hypothetical protein
MKSTQELFESFTDTVLLVGNGPIKNKGKLIDSYDTVIRFNDFVIDGYEKHVGTKISAIGFPSNNLHAEKLQHLLPVYGKYVDSIPLFCFSNGSPLYSGKMLSLEIDTRILSPEKSIRSNPVLTLTTGVATALNLSLFFNKIVHLIGFDFMKTGHYWDTTHIHAGEHDGNFEQRIISNIKNIRVL